MISADGDWQRTRVDYLLSLSSQTFAGGINLVEIFQPFVEAWQRMRAFNSEITTVVDFIAETRDSLCQSGNAHRRGPKMNSALALAVTQRHAVNRDGLC